MSDAETKANAAASMYLISYGHMDAVELARAKEDYIAGYIAGLSHKEDKISFAIRQIKAIMDLAYQHDEFYSGSIASYTLERLK